MSVIGNNILAGASGQSVGGGYVIDRSLRFRSSASAYLNRTPASAGNRRIWTYSIWLKEGALGTYRGLLEGYTGSPAFANRTSLQLDNGNKIDILFDNTSSGRITTTQVFRDTSAWYNFVFACDTTQATASNRFKLYVNGNQVTSFDTASYPSQNYETGINTTQVHNIGKVIDPLYFDGYLTEINFIDGQALTPTSFGEYNEDTGVWQPKEYEGTYGTNGFYLNFSDPTTLTTLTADQSGNGNNWTANNISLTSGATYDSMIDTPTPVTDVRGNFCVLNPLINTSVSGFALTNGNLTFSTNNTTSVGSSFHIPTTGKWYWEATVTALSTGVNLGIYDTAYQLVPGANPAAITVFGFGYDSTGGKLNNSTTSYGASYTTNDIIGIAFDADAGTLVFFKNNVSQGTAFSGLTGKVYAAYFAANTSTWNVNFGQRPFAYTPPSGFKALHTGNLPEPTIVDGGEYFNTVLYTGNGGTQSITGVGFQPDWVWLKVRDQDNNHGVFDVVRGVSQALRTNGTFAETTTNGITSFNADGFTFGGSGFNSSGSANVAWNWKANGAGVTNTAGSITSTVSANPTAGFSIVTFTGTTSNQSVGHGLGVPPVLFIVKSRAASENWWVYTTIIDGSLDFLSLNTTNAKGDGTQSASTSTVFFQNQTNNSVAYCFAEVPGYSRFGSYTGNGSADGPFVFCGFRPAWVMFKRTNSTGDWIILDTARNTFNVMNAALYPNLSIGEETATVIADCVSNGFKVRNLFANINVNGSTYIYAAFAENPFKYALAR